MKILASFARNLLFQLPGPISRRKLRRRPWYRLEEKTLRDNCKLQWIHE